MKLKETIGLIGELSIHKDDGSGPVLVFQETNLIVNTAKRAFLAYLYSVGDVSDVITSLHLGTGGDIDALGLFPKQEDPNQVSLVTDVLSLPVTYYVSPVGNSVTFLATADINTGNGYQINEAGLFKASGAMFNVKNFPAIQKASTFALSFTWVITFP